MSYFEFETKLVILREGEWYEPRYLDCSHFGWLPLDVLRTRTPFKNVPLVVRETTPHENHHTCKSKSELFLLSSTNKWNDGGPADIAIVASSKDNKTKNKTGRPT